MIPEEVTININNKYIKKVNPHEYKIENACLMKHDQMQMKILNCVVKYLNEFSNKANDERKKVNTIAKSCCKFERPMEGLELWIQKQ